MRKKASFRRLYELPRDARAMLDGWLMEGMTPGQASRKCHEKGMLADMPYSALQQQLRRYRDQVLRVRSIKIAQTATDEEVKSAVKEINRSVDILRRKIQLMHLQELRVVRMRDQETKLKGMLIDKTGHEMDRLLSIYRSVEETQMEMGLVRRIPKRMQAEIVLGTPGEARHVQSIQVQEQVASATRMALAYLVDEGVAQGQRSEVHAGEP